MLVSPEHYARLVAALDDAEDAEAFDAAIAEEGANWPPAVMAFPLTTIGQQCGTSVVMTEKHSAEVIENWDGIQQAPEAQIRAAREIWWTLMHVAANNVQPLINHESPANSQ